MESSCSSFPDSCDRLPRYLNEDTCFTSPSLICTAMGIAIVLSSSCCHRQYLTFAGNYAQALASRHPVHRLQHHSSLSYILAQQCHIICLEQDAHQLHNLNQPMLNLCITCRLAIAMLGQLHPTTLTLVSWKTYLWTRLWIHKHMTCMSSAVYSLV
jgi:hypothetical protein